MGDALDFDFAALGGNLRLAGNLPYNISTPILFHLLSQSHAVRDMHFMLQKEVVDRMAAEPGSKVYGRLSVMLQLACRVEPLFNVPPEAFRPPPKVESAVVRLLPLEPHELHDARPEHVYAVVKAAFGQRRKTLANALKQLLDSDAIRRADVDPKVRAETLAPADFVRIAKVYGSL